MIPCTDMSAAHEYIRQVLHHTEPPPPLQARFFYTSPIPIDHPLSPLPPPASGKAPVNQAPKPFSEYDNSSLDRAWNDLRRKILKYNEERGEKSTPHESTSRAHAASGAGRDGSRRGSGSMPGTPRAKQGRPPASSLSRAEGQGGEDLAVAGMDGPQSASEVAALPDTTGTPFIRAPSRNK